MKRKKEREIGKGSFVAESRRRRTSRGIGISREYQRAQSLWASNVFSVQLSLCWQSLDDSLGYYLLPFLIEFKFTEPAREQTRGNSEVGCNSGDSSCCCGGALEARLRHNHLFRLQPIAECQLPRDSRLTVARRSLIGRSLWLKALT